MQHVELEKNPILFVFRKENKIPFDSYDQLTIVAYTRTQANQVFKETVCNPNSFIFTYASSLKNNEVNHG